MNELQYTGYEVINDSGKIDLEKSINSMQESLIKRNSEKYEIFLKGLEKLKRLFLIIGVPLSKERLNLMKYTYYAMRLIDDVCDGDTPLKLNSEQKKTFINIALNNENNLNNLLLQNLLKEISLLSKSIGHEKSISKDIYEIIISINFDLERIINGGEVVYKEELEKNFHKMDIDGTIGVTAIIFGLDPLNTKFVLNELGEATRIGYTLEDFQNDIKSGIINIPKEDMEKLLITKKDLENFAFKGILSNGIKKWILIQIDKIDKLLEIYNNKIGKTKLEIKFPGLFGKFITTKIYNYLIKTKVLSNYVEETLKTKQKILSLISK